MKSTAPPLPRLSLVLTCYNLEDYIEEALKSVFCQDYKGERELIIVDDASKDNSVNVIKNAIAIYGKDWDITLIQNEQNLGVAGATDRGWNAAKYDWIVEIDGDDIQLPDRCSRTAELIKKYPHAGFISLSRICIDAAGKETGRVYLIENGHGDSYCAAPPHLRTDIYCSGFHKYPVDKGAFGCSMCIRKSIITQWGHLCTAKQERVAQDPPWELRAFMSAPVVWSNDFACLYRSHGSNILNKNRKYATLRDWINNERSSCQYACKEYQAATMMLQDVKRALNTPSLSDWSPELLAQCEAKLQQYALIYKLKSEWWSYNIFKRAFFAFKYKKHVPAQFSSWLTNRILPLTISIGLKKWLKK